DTRMFVYVVFFFHCVGACADRHSFPTRRSSDLWWRWATSTRACSRKTTRWRTHSWPRAGRRSTRPGACLSKTPTRTSSNRISPRSEEHTSELQSRENLVCRLLLEKKKKTKKQHE